MVQQQTVTLVDDIDGGKAHETVAFGLDGVSYEIDVHSRKAAALRKSLEDFVAAGRQVKPSSLIRRAATPKRSRVAGEPTPAEIRLWAAEAGVTVSERGRISAAVREQFLAARSN